MKIRSRRSLWQAVGLLGLDGLLFCTTDVSKVPSFIVIIGFGLLAATLYWVIRGLLRAGRLYGLTIRRQRTVSFYLTGIVAGLLALQSIGGLTHRDIMVLLPLSLIGYGYGIYLKNARRDLNS